MYLQPPHRYFRMVRKRRSFNGQGDPLSPFLFVLYLERLSITIDKSVAAKKLQPPSVCRARPRVSHLLFADDVLLFAKAIVNQASVVTDVITSFCQASSQIVSTEKSIAFVGVHEFLVPPKSIYKILRVLFFLPHWVIT